jgi:hypothetical protein
MLSRPMKPKQPLPTISPGRRDRFPLDPGSATAEPTDKDQIVEMLERQFHNSPSID